MPTISARIGNAVYAPGSTSLDENFADATLARQKPPLLAFVLSHSSTQLFVLKQSATSTKSPCAITDECELKATGHSILLVLTNVMKVFARLRLLRKRRKLPKRNKQFFYTVVLFFFAFRCWCFTYSHSPIVDAPICVL